MSFIKLEHIYVFNRTICIPAASAKNDSDGVITLPKKVIGLTIELDVSKSPNDYYLFSQDFIPGKEFASSKRFRDFWLKTVDSNWTFPAEYKFCSEGYWYS